jgi:predicted house-cleaning NTP pyrophosphatase (Maf/HAM1 superfamily)
MTTRSLVLASTSRIRRTLMDAAGLRYVVDAPNVDEETIAAPLLDPSARALALASAKAAVVLARHPHAVVIAADQVGVLDDGTFLDKPHSRQHHASQLAAMAGSRHRFFPAVVMATTDIMQAAVVPVQVWFHPRRRPGQLWRLLVRGGWTCLDCAHCWR